MFQAPTKGRMKSLKVLTPSATEQASPRGDGATSPKSVTGSVAGSVAASKKVPYAQYLSNPPSFYAYRTHNKKPLVTYRFLNLSSFLDLFPGGFF